MKPTFDLLPILALTTTLAAAAGPLPKKLIQTGWDTPDTAQFRRVLPAMEQWPSEV